MPGGGTAKLVTTRRLRRLPDRADWAVTADHGSACQFAPSLQWVMTGTRQWQWHLAKVAVGQ